MATKSRHLKTAIQLWVADQRKAGGYTSKDLADWTGVTTDTARGWESRGRPSEDAITILERKFGRQAPRGENATAPTDQSAVIAAIDRQTAAINANTAMLKAVLEALTARLPTPPPEVLRDLAQAEVQADEERRHTRTLPRSPAPGRQTEGTGTARREAESI